MPHIGGVGRVLRNSEGNVLAMFRDHVGCMESNEEEVLANSDRCPFGIQF